MKKNYFIKKMRIFLIATVAILVCGFFIINTAPVNATIESSTMVFQSVEDYTLTNNGDDTYTGVIPCVVGDGFDIYAMNGADA